jgi:hypothetical protein
VAADAAELVVNGEVVSVTPVLAEAVKGGDGLARSVCSTVGDTILAGSGVGALR